jgi:hypothetical protein
MTTIEEMEKNMDLYLIKETFERYIDAGEYLAFNRIPESERLSQRPDLCAFIFLDKLFPTKNRNDIVCAAEHDEIYLDVSNRQLLEADITDEQILYLVRCGVRMGDEGLCMFA